MEIIEDDFFMFSTQDIVPYSPSILESWFIRSNRSNYVLGRVLENMLYYFKHHSRPKEFYFVWFYIISALYRNDNYAKEIIDKIRYWSNHDALLMSVHYGLQAKYDDRLWTQLMNKCFVQKLTYKFDSKMISTKDDILLKHVLTMKKQIY